MAKKQAAEQAPESTAADEAPVEHVPTPAEALEMFAENPGLWAITTTEGVLTRS